MCLAAGKAGHEPKEDEALRIMPNTATASCSALLFRRKVDQCGKLLRVAGGVTVSKAKHAKLIIGDNVAAVSEHRLLLGFQ